MFEAPFFSDSILKKVIKTNKNMNFFELMNSYYNDDNSFDLPFQKDKK